MKGKEDAAARRGVTLVWNSLNVCVSPKLHHFRVDFKTAHIRRDFPVGRAGEGGRTWIFISKIFKMESEESSVTLMA